MSGVGSSSDGSLKQGPEDPPRAPRHQQQSRQHSAPRLAQRHQQHSVSEALTTLIIRDINNNRYNTRHQGLQQQSRQHSAPRHQQQSRQHYPCLFVFLKPLLRLFARTHEICLFLLPPNRSGLLRVRSCSIRYIFSNTAGGIGTAQLRHV